MNKDHVEGTLKQLGGRVKGRWGKVTHDAQRELAGQREQRTGKSQVLYGISRAEAAGQLKEFFARNSHWHRWNQ